MQVEIGIKELSGALGQIIEVVEKRTTIPVLSQIKMQTEKETVTLFATDLEVHMQLTIPAKVKKPGVLLCPARRLKEIVGYVSSGTVSFTLADNHWIHVKAGSAKYKLPSYSADTYPAFPETAKPDFAITGKTLTRAISATRFAITQEESRFNLCAILLANGDAVATDGHRMAIWSDKELKAFKVNGNGSSKKSAADLPNFGGVLLSRRGCNLLLLLVDAEKKVEVAISEDSLIFSQDNWILRVRRPTGVFPNYKAVIPSKEKAKLKVTVNAALLADHVNRVQVSADERTQYTKFSFTKGALTMLCHSPEAGEAVDSMEITNSVDMELAANGKFVLEYLRANEGEVTIHAADQESGILFEKEDSLYVVMPMRL
jgi:DNA polymerase-3 subunit beta